MSQKHESTQQKSSVAPDRISIFTVNMEPGIQRIPPSYEGVISGSVPSSPIRHQSFSIPLTPPPTYSGREAKPYHTHLRWNLLFTFLILLFVSSAFWIPFIPKVQNASMEIVVIIIAIMHLLWFMAVFNNCRYLWRLRRYKHHQIDLQKLNNSGKVVKHLVGITLYKEPIELMINTLDSIANQKDAKKKICAFVGMEQKTPDKEEKARKFHELYDSKFERFIVTFHPPGLPGEIPGKCSNLNYAARSAVSELRMTNILNSNVELLVTTGDCDTIFGDRYFDALEEDYWKTSPQQRGRTVWQSPLFYAINLHKSPFFVRATGLMRSFFMMGYLIPWNINTMSVFSLTLKLFEDGEYVHPGYQMEDIIALIRWTCAVRQRCIIRMIPVATLSGPTSGQTYLEELYEWARQIRRWTIGAAEVFHYFAIKSTRLPLSVSIVWAVRFIFYYGFLLCIASVYSIIAPFITTAMLNVAGHSKTQDGIFIPSSSVFTYINLGMLGLQYFWFFCVFLINKLIEPVFPQNQKDKTGFFRNVLHWLLAWPTITAYCCIEVFAFLEVTVRGKEVCNHGASKKEGLVSKPNKVAPVMQDKPKIMEIV